MELTDILTVEEWGKLTDEIFNRYGLNGAVFRSDNFRLVKSDNWANKICPIIQGGENVIICVLSQKNIAKLAVESKQPVLEECEAGFMKFVVPLFVKGEFLGVVGGCGCLLPDSNIDIFYLSKLLEKNEQEVEKLLSSVPQLSKEKLQEAMKFVEEKLDEILKQKNLK
jgi:ligand-binding sensor protein